MASQIKPAAVPSIKSYSVKSVAAMLDVSPKTVGRVIKAGDLEAYRVGPRIKRVTEQSLRDYVARKLAENESGDASAAEGSP